MPIDVRITIENVGRLVNAVAAGTGVGILWILPSLEGRGQGFTEAEDAFKCLAGGCKRLESELQAFQTDDGAAMAFDHGGDTIPIGSAKVATDNQSAIFDALHR